MTVIPDKPTRFSARTSADFVETFERFSDDAGETPLDLAGWTMRFAVKAAPLDVAVLLEATIANGRIVVVDADEGRFTVTFDKALLAGALAASLTELDGVYELQAAGPAGEDEVWAAGPFRLIRGV